MQREAEKLEKKFFLNAMKSQPTLLLNSYLTVEKICFYQGSVTELVRIWTRLSESIFITATLLKQPMNYTKTSKPILKRTVVVCIILDQSERYDPVNQIFGPNFDGQQNS